MHSVGKQQQSHLLCGKKGKVLDMIKMRLIRSFKKQERMIIKDGRGMLRMNWTFTRVIATKDTRKGKVKIFELSCGEVDAKTTGVKR